MYKEEYLFTHNINTELSVAMFVPITYYVYKIDI